MSTIQNLANAIRFLSVDAVEKANSGHPGMPMGMADIATVLWRDFLKHNPANPNWIDRDRFVLSNGHGAMLLYSLLHLTGYDLTVDDLKKFRQLNSKTPGHPEYGMTPGVEVTSGPLGQGIAAAVGMAIAEKILATKFNQPGYDIFDHHTYVFLGDGCLMEGVSHEVCSLAGTYKLGKLIAFWDNNGISIDGDVSGWFTDNTAARFEAYGWHVIRDVDGHDPESIHKSIVEARFVNDRPSLICCRTKIAYGASKLCGSCKAHGTPLGAEEILAARKNLNWPHPPFVIPEDIYAAWNAKPRGLMLEKHWQDLFSAYKKEFPELAIEFMRRINRKLPENWQEICREHIEVINAKPEDIATRKASQNCLNIYAPKLPELVGGSADLTESNLTFWNGAKIFNSKTPAGNYLHYGVREFGMFAIMNGIALHAGCIPFGGTFLVFSDYGRNAIRLSALMKLRVIFVLSHDSIGLGEDGPTHQPIEHLAALRMIPELSVWRPCDLLETAVAWQFALSNHGPTCIALTRQKVNFQNRDNQVLMNVNRGGYVLLDCAEVPEIIIIATGSEVDLAVKVASELTNQKRNVRVVSMPSTDVFDKQNEPYKLSVLPKSVTKRIAIEAGRTDFWYKYVGLDGKVIGLDEFGKSAPYQDLCAEFGFTVSKIIETIDRMS